ncbi:hypothetical protein [Chryseobacterium sp.]|jgi:hypothetical protein|uniref:hypothetical protein n=1 Tax=Chryseobacterium sp. TaxID=1871047 RepID=UPI0028510549|nr:hypothetical protein [Chryseobacterium sp.]MDR3026032.1 hypothetical protein [Chryseobacterium sp.]
MNKEIYVVQDFINDEYPEFATIEECKNYILTNFTDESEGIHPDVDDMVILKKEFYAFVNEDSNNEIELKPFQP